MSGKKDSKGDSARSILKFITFGLGRERFGIAIEDVKEIIAAYEIVPLPRTPEFIEGIISLRGEIIPVVDMRIRFDMPHGDSDEETRVIVLEMTDFYVGIQVDNVYEVLKLEEDVIEPPPKLVGGLKGDYIEGVAEVKGKLTIILNLEEIFSSSEKIAMQGSIESHDEANDKAEAGVSSEPQIKAGETPATESCKVSAAGQIDIRGKNYYIGKKFKGKELTIEEKDGVVSVFEGDEKIKEFGQ